MCPTLSRESQLARACEMREVCPVCGASTSRSIPAEIAPFLRVRAQIPQEATARSYFCERCEHVFLTPLLSQEQLARHHEGHRGPVYDAQRLEIEPSYAGLRQELEDRSSGYYQARTRYYDSMLSEWKSFHGLVVDFGGGDGHWTQHVFPLARTVVADESFERDGGNLPSLLRECDILFAAHVFEHFPEPTQALSRLSRMLRRDAKVYVELPVDYQGGLRATFETLENRAAQGIHDVISSLQQLHEHVAHFSRHSMRMLAARSGLVVEEVISFPGGMAMWAKNPA